MVLFGPSGSGKTLTLKAIAGLLRPEKGHISVNGRILFDSASGVDVPTRNRKLGFLFQDYALFPHLSIRDNVGFGLKRLLRPLSRKDQRKVDETLEVFGLTELADMSPLEISGGQRQRTALARCLVREPEILLLDEPFSALDQPLRLRMRRELAQVLDRYRIPLVMVTHDTDEVDFFAKTVVVYAEGKVHNILNADGDYPRDLPLSRRIAESAGELYAGMELEPLRSRSDSGLGYTARCSSAG
jgi:molybdate transport system ATP-binding protein